MHRLLSALLAVLFSSAVAFAGVSQPPTDLTSINNRIGFQFLPFVLVCGGQSNEAGNSPEGDKTVGANILIWNGSAMIPAAFLTAPLNLGGSTLPTVYNNACVHMANYIRASGYLPASTPIYIEPNWFPGQAISQWIGTPDLAPPQGTAAPNFVSLTTMLAGVQSWYNANVGPGFLTVNVFDWDQGEADSTTAPNTYNSQTLYAGAFSTLMSQWSALPQWTSSSVVIAQELGSWACAAYLRNDYFDTIPSMANPRFLFSSAAGAVMSPAQGCDHFSGTTLVSLGHQRAAAILSALGYGTYPLPLRSASGLAQAARREISIAHGVTQAIGPDDLRNGLDLVLEGNAVTSVPNTNYVQGGVDLNVDVTSITNGTPTVTNTQGFYLGSLGGDAVTTWNPGVGKYHFTIDNNRWRLESTFPNIGNTVMNGPTAFTSGAAVTLLDQDLQNAVFQVYGNAIGLPQPLAGRRAAFIVRSVSAGAPVISRTDGTLANFLVPSISSGGSPTTADSLTLGIGERVELLGGGGYWIVMSDSANEVRLLRRVRSITAGTTIALQDYTIEADATAAQVPITLPPCNTTFGFQGRVLNIKKIDSSANAVNINRAGTDTIDGATTKALTTQYANAQIQCDGAGMWMVQ